MIVPQFKLKQNQSHLQVFIRVPYIKVNACQFYIQRNMFKFYLKPYLLSLTFDQNLREVEEPSKAIYYHEKYILQVHLQKEKTGEVFQNLDLLANVVNNKKNKKKNKINVEVIGQQNSVLFQEENKEVSQFNYGFAMNYSKHLDNLQEQTAQLFEFDPKLIPLSKRYQLSNQILIKQFDYESYLFDKYDNQEEIKSLIKDDSFLKHITQISKKKEGEDINSSQFKLKMSGKEILISKKWQDNILKEILSIVFSYIYEMICMNGQFGVQSAKTINRTSLVLSCNSYYQGMTIKDTIINCSKRCATFSLYKSLLITQKTIKYLQQLTDIQTFILILTQLKQHFDKNEPRYLLNQLFINDYLIYLYSLKNVSKEIQTIRKQVASINVLEEDWEFGIEQYEQMDDSSEQQEEEKKEVKKLEKDFQKFNTLD